MQRPRDSFYGTPLPVRVNESVVIPSTAFISKSFCLRFCCNSCTVA